MAQFKWTRKRELVALSLAQGYTNAEAAKDANVGERTVNRWKKHLEFQLEVDRLSLMVGISSKAERLRIAMRAVRQGVAGAGVKTKKDVLDWIKFVQSETDGAKLDLSSIFQNMEDAARDREETKPDVTDNAVAE